MQGTGTETPRPQGSAAQKKWTNSWDKSQHEQWRANQTCYNCGKKGHIRPDCKAKPQQNNQNNQRRPGNQQPPRSRFTGNCHNCGKPGHKQAECRTRINTLEFYQEPEIESESEEEEVLREHETVRNTRKTGDKYTSEGYQNTMQDPIFFTRCLTLPSET